MIKEPKSDGKIDKNPSQMSRTCKGEEVWYVHGNEGRPLNGSKGERERAALEEVGKGWQHRAHSLPAISRQENFIIKCNVFERVYLSL